MKRNGPQRQVCPLCALDDDDYVSWEVEGPGLWRYTCTNPQHDEPYGWLTTGRDPLNTSGHDGLSDELGIYDDLLACFTTGEPYLEYGIVEYRYALHNPAAYKRLIGLYSHTSIKRPLEYSASAFIGAAIGKLGREGLLVHRPCKATGYWSYNGSLNGWALAPGPADAQLVSWHDYATQHELDPHSWPTTLVT